MYVRAPHEHASSPSRFHLDITHFPPQALLFMHTWLEAHPVYRALVEGSDMPDYGSYQMLGHVTGNCSVLHTRACNPMLGHVAAQFKRAAEMNADDADVSTSLNPRVRLFCSLRCGKCHISHHVACRCRRLLASCATSPEIMMRLLAGSSKPCEYHLKVTHYGISSGLLRRAWGKTQMGKDTDRKGRRWGRTQRSGKDISRIAVGEFGLRGTVIQA